MLERMDTEPPGGGGSRGPGGPEGAPTPENNQPRTYREVKDQLSSLGPNPPESPQLRQLKEQQNQFMQEAKSQGLFAVTEPRLNLIASQLAPILDRASRDPRDSQTNINLANAQVQLEQQFSHDLEAALWNNPKYALYRGKFEGAINDYFRQGLMRHIDYQSLA